MSWVVMITYCIVYCHCATKTLIVHKNTVMCPCSLYAVASPCIEEAAALVSDADLSLTAAALRFFVTLLLKKPALAPIVVDKVLPQVTHRMQFWFGLS